MSHFSLGAQVLTVMLLVCGLAEARPLNLRDSTPADEAILDDRNAQYVIRLNGWRERQSRRIPDPDPRQRARCSGRIGACVGSRPIPAPLAVRNPFLTAISQTGSSHSRSGDNVQYGLRFCGNWIARPLVRTA